MGKFFIIFYVNSIHTNSYHVVLTQWARDIKGFLRSSGLSSFTNGSMPNSLVIVFEASEFDGTGEFCSICVNCNCDSYEKFVVKCLPSALPFFF